MVEIGTIPPYRPSRLKRLDQEVAEKSSVGKERDQQQQKGQKKSDHQDEHGGEEDSHFDGYA